MLSKASAILVLTSISPLTFAHSHVDEIWAPNPSVHYQGWNPNDWQNTPYPADTPGWFTTNQGGNPLYPIDANQPQIICAKGGSPANISAPISDGDTVRVKWWQVPGDGGEWPPSHKGPVINYLAACNGPCSSVDPLSLQFVKIAATGWIDDHVDEGYWAADALRDDDSSWNVIIPTGLAPGEYVLRTEIIALHLADLGTGAYSPIGAEFYPQCVNLKVEGSGTKLITGGILGESLYRGDEPGIEYKTLHETNEHADYIIPGPPIWSGALKKMAFKA